MEKPLAVKREEFLTGIVSLINGCGLPPFVVSDILDKLSAEVAKLARQQYEAEKAAWEESNKEVKEDG